MENKTYITIWDNKNGKPYITFCQEDYNPIYSIECNSAKQRNEFLFKLVKEPDIEIYCLNSKLVQLNAVLNNYLNDGYCGMVKATSKRISEDTSL